MRAYGIKRKDNPNKCKVKGCNCHAWDSKYPKEVPKRKGPKDRRRKKSARQSLRVQQL